MSAGQVILENEQRDRASRQSNDGLLCPACAAAIGLLMFSVGCHGRSADQRTTSIVELTDANFQQEVIEAEQPVLVEFWAPWCQPCVEMMPAMEQVAQEFSGRAKVGKLRIDDNDATSSAFGVESPPTIIIFRDGKEFKRRHGKQSKDSLAGLLSASLSRNHFQDRPEHE